LRKQQHTPLGVIRETTYRQRATAEEIENLKSGANITNALGEGLKSSVQQELQLKERTMQAQTVLNKALAKLEAIEKINPENLEEEDEE
jgi:hypothetical protein